jgi:branched-chain amino acid transport system permease protein
MSAALPKVSLAAPSSRIAPSNKSGSWLALTVLAVVAISLPNLVTDYRVFQVTMTLIAAIAILGLNLLVGYNGQLSLGHGAIYAIGAYTTAILMTQAALPYWATVPIAAAVCFVFGFLFGWPAVRLTGHYLALATFALALATPQLLKHRLVEHWTGGVQGLVLTKPDAPFGLAMSQDHWLYYFILAIAALLFWLAWNLVRGRLGRAAIAIREQPIAASAMGVNVAYTKAMTFGISAGFTGVAGALSAIASQFVAPDSFGMFVSIFFLVGVVIGGVGTIWGALIGGAFIQFIPNVADQISKAAPSAIYGLFLIATVYLMPGGCIGLIRSIRKRFNGRGKVVDK